MIKILKYSILSIFSLIMLLITFLPEDPAWVDCSDEKDLYNYIIEGWKVNKVIKKEDISYTKKGFKQYYLGDEPEIYLSKENKIKVLSFEWRCWFEQGPEVNYKSIK
jgi:hypothetical protein